MPWTQVPINIRFALHAEITLDELVSKLVAVIESDSEFNDSLTRIPKELVKNLENSRTPSDIIELVSKYCE